MNDKKNAYDVLRILLALGVLTSHALLIGGYPLQDPLAHFSKGQTDLADFCVMGFFALSGYLIAASFERAPNTLVYISHRILRILPGFLVCLLITAFIFAPLIFVCAGGSLQTFSFGGQDSSLSFALRNCLLEIRQWSIHGVLDQAAYQGSLNGSLWTLYPEVQCYAFTLIAGASGLFQKNKSLYLIISVIFFIFFSVSLNFHGSFGPTVFVLSPAMKLYAAYIAGTLVYVFHEQLLFDKRGTLFLFGFTVMLLKFGGFKLVSPLLTAIALINLFSLFKLRLKYDISFGVYIYGFVIEQLLFAAGGHRLSPSLYITLAIGLSVVAGTLSYVLIERPFMQLRQRTDRLLTRRPQPSAIVALEEILIEDDHR